MTELAKYEEKWLGKLPANWKIIRAKFAFEERKTKGNSDLTLLSPSQKFGVIPQSQLEGVVKVKESTDLGTFQTVKIGDFVISLRSFQGGFEY